LKPSSSTLVSVVIPAYNGQETIHRAINSVLQQTYRNHEIIVVDDGSTDSTLHVLNSLGSQITLISQRNAGATSARNIGAEHANVAYIAFLDQDDWWTPKKLEIQVRALEADPSLGLVFGNLEAVERQEKSLRFMTIFPEHRHSPSLDDLLLLFPLYPSSATLRKDLFDTTGGFDTRFGSSGAYGDQDFHIRLRQLASFRFLDLRVGYYFWDELRPGRFHNFLVNLPIFAQKYWNSPLLVDSRGRFMRERFMRTCTNSMMYMLRRLLQHNGNIADSKLLFQANMYNLQLKEVFGASYLTMELMDSLNLKSMYEGKDVLKVQLSTLLYLYLCRRDLQRRFPEVFQGNLTRLADWAFGVARGVRLDKDYTTLAPFREYYETLTHDVPLIAISARRNSYLIGKGIQVFYRIMGPIDRMYPDGTLSGRLRRVATASLQTITEEGFRSFMAKVKQTLKQREFVQ